MAPIIEQIPVLEFEIFIIHSAAVMYSVYAFAILDSITTVPILVIISIDYPQIERRDTPSQLLASGAKANMTATVRSARAMTASPSPIHSAQVTVVAHAAFR